MVMGVYSPVYPVTTGTIVDHRGVVSNGVVAVSVVAKSAKYRFSEAAYAATICTARF
jgi:hypothetical protein